MKIRNWKQFQHFKDRRPPWIKLYREVVYQRDIMMLSSCNFRVLILLWCIASEDPKMEGNLPPIDDLSFKLRIPQDALCIILNDLKDFLEDTDDIKTISKRYQDDTPETETETETEKNICVNFQKEKLLFDRARKLYPGKKRGLDTEFENCRKKHKDWKELVRLLDNGMTVLERCIDIQIEAKETEKRQTGFTPNWAAFAVWINQRKFEEYL